MKLISWRNIINWIFLGIFIISLSIAITINFTPLYYFFVYHYHLASLVKMTNQQLITEYHQLLSYLNFPWQKQLRLSLPSTASAREHFLEVKHLFEINYLCLILTFYPTLSYLHRLKITKCWWELLFPCKIFGSLTIGLFILASLDFNDFFVYFHLILFRNQDWVFDPQKDPIIKVLPEEFFAAAFALFFLLIGSSFVFCLIQGKKSLKK
jgi:integral membrane protein (TIGR01906 family)